MYLKSYLEEFAFNFYIAFSFLVIYFLFYLTMAKAQGLYDFAFFLVSSVTSNVSNFYRAPMSIL